MSNYTDLRSFDRSMTEAELTSEQRKPPAPTQRRGEEDRVDEIIDATRAKLAELRREMKAADKEWMEAAIKAVGEVLARERKERGQMRDELRAEFTAELERQVAALKIEFLQQQLDAERMKKLKLVPSSSGSMIA
jgi:hypothetical protein